jgi:cobalt-zinc-cadmium efflux system protein
VAAESHPTPDHDHTHPHRSVRNIKAAFFLNAGFTLLEIAGGILTNSMAILSDALHDLGDSFSLGMAWFFERYASRGSDHRYSFGYRRFSLLSAMLNGLVLIGGSVLILSQAIPRILHPESANAKGMLAFAVLGVLVNGAAVLKLRKGRTLNEKVVLWHLLEDVLGWIAVLIVSIVLMFSDAYVLDPILSTVITLYVLVNILRKVKKMLPVFLQGVPEGMRIGDFEKKIEALEPVLSTHHTHIWSLDGRNHVLTTHVVVKDDTEKEQIIALKCAIKELVTGSDISHITVEIEYEDEECGMR